MLATGRGESPASVHNLNSKDQGRNYNGEKPPGLKMGDPSHNLLWPPRDTPSQNMPRRLHAHTHTHILRGVSLSNFQKLWIHTGASQVAHPPDSAQVQWTCLSLRALRDKDLEQKRLREQRVCCILRVRGHL